MIFKLDKKAWVYSVIIACIVLSPIYFILGLPLGCIPIGVVVSFFCVEGLERSGFFD